MPRPSGKAQEIAEKTVPGLNCNHTNKKSKKIRSLPKDPVELKIVSINENRGR